MKIINIYFYKIKYVKKIIKKKSQFNFIYKQIIKFDIKK